MHKNVEPERMLPKNGKDDKDGPRGSCTCGCSCAPREQAGTQGATQIEAHYKATSG